MAADFPFPMIRLEVEGMRHQIVHAFSQHCETMKQQVEEATKAAIDQFDFPSEVARIADGLLRDAIRSALKDAFNKLSWNEAMRAALVKTLLDELSSQGEPPK